MQQFKNFAQNMQNLGNDFALWSSQMGSQLLRSVSLVHFWGYTSVSILMDQFQLLRRDIIVQFTVRIIQTYNS